MTYQSLGNVCDQEIWFPDLVRSMPPVHRECGVVVAVDPALSNQDFYCTHPGGAAWESMRCHRRGESAKSRRWRASRPEERARHWEVFGQIGTGVSAPVSDLKAL